VTTIVTRDHYSLRVIVVLELNATLKLKCALQPKIAKNLFKTVPGWSRSFKIIDVNKSKKPVAGACYDKQHVCTYFQPFSRYTRQYQ